MGGFLEKGMPVILTAPEKLHNRHYIQSAARSPIIMAVAFMFARGTLGTTDASATRSPSIYHLHHDAVPEVDKS